MLGIVKKTFENKTFVGIIQQCFALLPQVNFPANNLNFHWRWRWWDRIHAIFLNLFYFIAQWIYIEENSLKITFVSIILQKADNSLFFQAAIVKIIPLGHLIVPVGHHNSVVTVFGEVGWQQIAKNHAINVTVMFILSSSLDQLVTKNQTLNYGVYFYVFDEEGTAWPLSF